MRRFAALTTAALLLTSACSAEVGLGLSEVAAPRDTCVPASSQAVSAVQATLAARGGVLTAATTSECPADRGFDNFPEYIFAARYVSLDQAGEVATWALSGRSDFVPIYPLNGVARGLTDPAGYGAGSDLVEHMAKWDNIEPAGLARECASVSG